MKKLNVTATKTVAVASGVTYLAYGIEIEDDKNQIDSPFAFTAYDLWFDEDFDYFLENMLDDILDELESDITSVWSTNESEQLSQQLSAQASADARAAGMTTMSVSTGTSVDTNNESSERASDISLTATADTDSSVESTSEAGKSTVSDTHSHGTASRLMYHYPHSGGESSHSGTLLSKNLSGETGGSRSHGTSQRTGEASTLSTVSIKLKKFKEFFANDNTTTDDLTLSVELLSAAGGSEFGHVGGLKWEGDEDNEYIFGTAWLDKLYGGAGNDILYGFEGDDAIYGQAGKDRLFGDGGDDLIVTGDNDTPADAHGDFASGGSGNDTIKGDMTAAVNEVLFGGPGHDLLYGYGGDDTMYGGPGRDYIEATDGNNHIFGGDGDDEILA